jgi:hypothetical protein
MSSIIVLSSSLYFYEARKTENTKPLKLELYLPSFWPEGLKKSWPSWKI